ncbi:MAG TPA: glycosyltransferase family 2 protein, partial [Verrucomicrobiae bacterium]|nr:glycosyltransferase family 2 protein [Verrucomicrobiae bacterium]
GVRGEVIIADNGSTDGSIEIAQRLGARLIPVPTKGYGSALRGGVQAARGKWIIMGDSDDSYDFSDIKPFVAKFREGYELIMGCRMPYGGGRIMPGAMPWKHRWLGNPVLSFIGRLFFSAPITDFHCGLRGFTRAGFDKMELKTKGMEFASEMVIKSTVRDLKITEVPITLFKDGRSRPPHLRSWRDGWRHLRFMLLFSPRWLFLAPGLILFVLGIGLGVPLFFGPIKIGNAIYIDTNTLLLAGMMAIVGFQVFFFGVFTRLYSVARGLVPDTAKVSFVREGFSLEKGIIAGIAMCLAGIAFLVAAILKWKAAGFGGMSYPESLRLVIPAMTFLTLGIQIIFSSFFLSILDLKHD